MDVNLTISLMRGQMGVVIEKAVNAAVETVLGEMIRVVSLKFEQLRREMSAKDKENQDIRKMLETSRCQMKILRQKYINALNAKDHRQAFLQQRHMLAQFSLPTAHHHVQAEPSSRAAAATTTTTTTPPHTGSSSAAELHTSVPKTRSHEPPAPAAIKKHTAIHQETVPTNPEPHSHEVQGPNAHLGLKVENSSVAPPDSADPQWAQTSLAQASAEAERTDASDPNLLPVPHAGEVLNAAEADRHERPVRVKQEEDEVQIIEVKQELVNQSTSEGPGPRIELHQQGAGAGVSVELPVSQQCVQIPGPSGTEPSAFRGLEPGTCPHVARESEKPWIRAEEKQKNVERTRRYRERINADPVKREAMLAERRRRYQEKKGRGESMWARVLHHQQKRAKNQKLLISESQLAVAGAQRHVRPYCKDLTLYEDYKRKRSEVRKRSETRRRELEQTLPQALLADLVKERREKTRLRVARWRAKRKLQACLMAQAGQFNGTQALYAQCNGRRRAGAPSEQGGISLGAVQPGEPGLYTVPLQMASSPLLAAQRLNMAEGQMQPGAAAFLQQRTSGTETYP